MIRSMTAFGRARMTTEERDVTVEIKSVNSRYLDCSVKMPRRYSFLEEKVKAYIQQNGISRGKVDVYISVDTLSEADTEILVDEGYARGYISALECLRDLFGLQDDISVMQVARDRDVFTFRRAEDNPERDWDVLKEALDGALRGFLGAREAEGRRIEQDIRSKIEGIRRQAERIGALSQTETISYHERLTERIKQLLDDNNMVVDEGRLLTECAIYADRVAIDEELTRLSCHFSAFDDILAAKEPCGRKLDFLLQEINRETNTIGSKTQCLDVTRLVVDIKAELEKIREQIQNIE